jgi:hypothetical protein
MHEDTKKFYGNGALIVGIMLDNTNRALALPKQSRLLILK